MPTSMVLRLGEDDRDVVRETFETALAEAKEVLQRHESEEPPMSESQTTSEAAEDYLQLIGTQQHRVTVLDRLLQEVSS